MVTFYRYIVELVPRMCWQCWRLFTIARISQHQWSIITCHRIVRPRRFYANGRHRLCMYVYIILREKNWRRKYICKVIYINLDRKTDVRFPLGQCKMYVTRSWPACPSRVSLFDLFSINKCLEWTVCVIRLSLEVLLNVYLM